MVETEVLVLVDVQNDFCGGGALAVPGADEIVPVVNRLAARFPHVLLTQDWHPPGHSSFASQHPGRAPYQTIALPYGEQILWPDHCVQGTRGADFHPHLAAPHAELVLRKGFRREIDSYSIFFENDRSTPTGLEGYLRERGLQAHLPRGARARLLRPLVRRGRPPARFRGRRVPGRLPRCRPPRLGAEGPGHARRDRRPARPGRTLTPPIPSRSQAAGCARGCRDSRSGNGRGRTATSRGSR